MTKKMCKLSSRAIGLSMGAIYAIVSEPKFVCRSCARVADKSISLCRPTPIPPQSCRNKTSCVASIEECAMLAEAQQTQQLMDEDVLPSATKDTHPSSSSVETKTHALETAERATIASDLESVDSQHKVLKQQKKLYKKLNKLLQKEQKLLQRRAELDARLSEVLQINPDLLSKRTH
ncbi:hypothetical protein [Vibrio gallicus]|uniref:hypothetical protein n=1 Tax=Vibrio gallicus TaxID=190897 RepID=UPI0021C33D63|nr:hypothetical protein [Vibrio gallicus]